MLRPVGGGMSAGSGCLGGDGRSVRPTPKAEEILQRPYESRIWSSNCLPPPAVPPPAVPPPAASSIICLVLLC